MVFVISGDTCDVAGPCVYDTTSTCKITGNALMWMAISVQLRLTLPEIDYGKRGG
jgi:hypothetical protein